MKLVNQISRVDHKTSFKFILFGKNDHVIHLYKTSLNRYLTYGTSAPHTRHFLVELEYELKKLESYPDTRDIERMLLSKDPVVQKMGAVIIKNIVKVKDASTNNNI